MNVQCFLIRELRLYEFKVGHNALESTKTISYTKGDGTVDSSTVKLLIVLHARPKSVSRQKESIRRTLYLPIHYGWSPS